MCDCLANLGRLCDSGAKVTSFSSQISSSSEPASSNCWIFSLQRASNKAIFAWGKTHKKSSLSLQYLHIQKKSHSVIKQRLTCINTTVSCRPQTDQFNGNKLHYMHALLHFTAYLCPCSNSVVHDLVNLFILFQPFGSNAGLSKVF